MQECSHILTVGGNHPTIGPIRITCSNTCRCKPSNVLIVRSRRIHVREILRRDGSLIPRLYRKRMQKSCHILTIDRRHPAEATRSITIVISSRNTILVQPDYLFCMRGIFVHIGKDVPIRFGRFGPFEIPARHIPRQAAKERGHILSVDRRHPAEALRTVTIFVTGRNPSFSRPVDIFRMWRGIIYIGKRITFDI